MYNLKTETFTAYNGLQIPFTYREDTNDYNTIISIIDNDEYRTKEMTYSPGDVFVDLGAYIGGWSSLMEHLVPDSKVISVEPLPENVELLKKNIKGTIIPMAALNCSHKKTKIFYSNDSEFGLHHKFVGNAVEQRGEKYHEPETISLKDILRDTDHVRVLKIDIEASEYRVFPFTDKDTWGKIDYIIGEYHNFFSEPSRTRAKLFSYTRGLFEDISVDKQEHSLGQFWFKNKHD